MFKALRQPVYVDRLRSIQSEAPYLQRFKTWEEVIDFARSLSLTDPRGDEILRPLLVADRRDQTKEWMTVLALILWPLFKMVCGRAIRWDRNSPRTERQSNVYFTFLECIAKLDPARRQERIAQKVFFDTLHNTYQGYKKDWDRQKREVLVPVEVLDRLESQRDWGIAVVHLELEQQHRARALERHRDLGRLSDDELDLLIQTRVFRQPLKEYAAAKNLNYEAIKKRRQRAEARVSLYESLRDGSPSE